MNCLVTGSGGFIGGHLVKRLLEQGHSVRAVDIKPLDRWWQRFRLAENMVGDLRLRDVCQVACKDMEHVYNLAADMGGIGFIENNKTACMLSVLINTHMLLEAVATQKVQRVFYSSSACVYAAQYQGLPDLPALKEGDVSPAAPEDGYGEEKLFSEAMCRHFMRDHGIVCRVARFHNIYGPYTEIDGGREKAPAAICRKVAEAKRTGDLTIDVWGDGTRTRSFTWIEDCLEGIHRLMHSDVDIPLNVGSSERVTINELVDVVQDVAGVEVRRRYDTSKPQGVHGRNSDNTLIQNLLGWEPRTSLRYGIERTYEWVEEQVLAKRST